jgi:hypothetical protein
LFRICNTDVVPNLLQLPVGYRIGVRRTQPLAEARAILIRCITGMEMHQPPGGYLITAATVFRAGRILLTHLPDIPVRGAGTIAGRTPSRTDFKRTRAAFNWREMSATLHPVSSEISA